MVIAGATNPSPQYRDGRWRIRWVDAHGRRRSETHVSEADAQFALDSRLLEQEQFVRGLRGLAVPDRTFNDLCDAWLATRARQKRSADDDQSIIRAHLRPHFGKHLLREIDVELVNAFMLGRTSLAPKTVNNHLTLLIAMLNEAKNRGWLAVAPRIRKFKVSSNDADYRWLRTDDEIARFLRAARGETNQQVWVLYATAIYTGMRAGELAALRWSNVNFEARRITIAASFEGPTKSGSVRHVPLLDVLANTFREWRLRTSGQLVFTNTAGNMLGESHRHFQETLHDVLERAKFPLIGPQKQRYIVFHSLRHTFASHWMMKGGDIFRLQKILGHKSLQMTMRYAHLAPDAFAGDMNRFGHSVPGEPGTVTELPGASKSQRDSEGYSAASGR